MYLPNRNRKKVQKSYMESFYIILPPVQQISNSMKFNSKLLHVYCHIFIFLPYLYNIRYLVHILDYEAWKYSSVYHFPPICERCGKRCYVHINWNPRRVRIGFLAKCSVSFSDKRCKRLRCFILVIMFYHFSDKHFQPL